MQIMEHSKNKQDRIDEIDSTLIEIRKDKKLILLQESKLITELKHLHEPNYRKQFAHNPSIDTKPIVTRL